MTMRIWLILPVIGLAAIGGMAVLGSQPARVEEAKRAASQTPLVHLAAIQNASGLSDACVWSPELAASGTGVQCTTRLVATPTPLEAPSDGGLGAARQANRALVWPDDFIVLTAEAAEEVWEAAVAVLSDIYEYAFSGEKPDPASGA